MTADENMMYESAKYSMVDDGIADNSQYSLVHVSDSDNIVDGSG